MNLKQKIKNLIEEKKPNDKLLQEVSKMKTKLASASSIDYERGIVGEMIAKAIGDLREYTDEYRNIHEKKYTIEESLKDIKEDLEANQEGRDLGRQYPTENPYELLKHRIPNGFPDRYKGY